MLEKKYPLSEEFIEKVRVDLEELFGDEGKENPYLPLAKAGVVDKTEATLFVDALIDVFKSDFSLLDEECCIEVFPKTHVYLQHPGGHNEFVMPVLLAVIWLPNTKGDLSGYSICKVLTEAEWENIKKDSAVKSSVFGRLCSIYDRFVEPYLDIWDTAAEAIQNEKMRR